MRTKLAKLLVTVFYVGNLAGLFLFWLFKFALPQHHVTGAMLLIDLGHISGLLAAVFILAELLMVSRIPIVEEAYALDELTRIHRLNGYAAFILMLLHIIFTTAGYEFQRYVSFLNQFINFTFHYEDVLKAVLGATLFILVTVTSIRAAKKHFSYEAWYFIHISAYLAVYLAFGHQLKVGPDFIGHPLFRDYWYLLYFGTAALLLWYRFAVPLMSVPRFGLRVASVKKQTHDSYTVTLTGHDFTYTPGQFASWYFLAPGLWWQGHPFSFSSAPGEPLAFTVKASGDYTAALERVQPGTPVLVDGPHGKFTLSQARSKKLLMIAGGVGITPLFSMLQAVQPGDYQVELIYAVRGPEDLIFRAELTALAALDHVTVRVLYSQPPTGAPRYVDTTTLQNVPDLTNRDVYLCGPTGMMKMVTKELRELGVPARAIHSERFDY